MLGYAFTTQFIRHKAIYISALLFTSCLLRDQLEVRASCVFPECTFNPGHTHSPTHVLSLLVSQEYVVVSQIPCGHLFPQIILLVFYQQKAKILLAFLSAYYFGFFFFFFQQKSKILLAFLLAYYFPQLLSTTSGSHRVEQFSVIATKKHSEKKRIWGRSFFALSGL